MENNPPESIRLYFEPSAVRLFLRYFSGSIVRGFFPPDHFWRGNLRLLVKKDLNVLTALLHPEARDSPTFCWPMLSANHEVKKQ